MLRRPIVNIGGLLHELPEGDSLPGGAGFRRLFRLTASGTITVTQDMIDANDGWFVLHMAGGGGGGGGGGITTTSGAGGNGGAGAGGGEDYLAAIYIPNPGTYNVVVGAGGLGGSGGSSPNTGQGSGSAGADGGDTYVVIDGFKYRAVGGAAGVSLSGGSSGGFRKYNPATGSTPDSSAQYVGYGPAGVSTVGRDGISSGSGGGITNGLPQGGGGCIRYATEGGAAGGAASQDGAGGGASVGNGGKGGVSKAVNLIPDPPEPPAPNSGAGGGGGAGLIRNSTAINANPTRGADGSDGFFELWGVAA